ncbi:class I SAM-dependent methyltransferase [Cytobacillus gottheilii]|uniref:Class I SAM-dependent methyltransferase n=1 Tax=Cytobacillus gottheilii TaxID=859144 RepID=A0ABX8F6K9_9BACI|nr:class I SAM-dependent methyltransferase [Cytobacillus gottheilii]QVY60081.1 class I SAM-dependent methyltransferase [Cytobacillus gottheilii]
MLLTTCGRPDEQNIQQARQAAEQLGIRFVYRKKRSIQSIQEQENSDCIVFGKERLELYRKGEREPFFFHPNSAMFRMKRIIRDEHDPFLTACNLSEGNSFLDCTLGLAGDSIMASYAVGSTGEVAGIEANPFIAYIVKNGLRTWSSGVAEMDEAMKRITVRQGYALNVLKNLPDNRFDCVYFDPMFEECIDASEGIKTLKNFAVYEPFTSELINEAIRVAKDRVVLKDHFRSEKFINYNFEVIKRKSAKFHYGIKLKESNN